MVSITKSAQETANLGQALAKQLLEQKRGEAKPIVICLYGELGSGKTTFTQGFAKGLGITSRLLSPTFIIVRRYAMPNNSGFLYHLDLYRLKSGTELDGLGLSEIFREPNSVVMVEWAEKLGKFLPQKRIDIYFSVNAKDEHVFKAQKVG